MRRLNKPHYLFRPAQVLRRLAVAAGRVPREVTLPWGLPIRFDPEHAVGNAIARTGVYDLAVCEALHRLVDPGELAIDAGANIGAMTSVLATRVGPEGEVVAVEPHPQTFEVLAGNVERWGAAAAIELVQAALSDRPGRAVLLLSDDPGEASLESRGAAVAEVDCVTLDTLLGARAAGILKLDVEGHEESVLRGASRALAERRIRDVVFEERIVPPTPVTRRLEDAGYALFALDARLLRLRLADLDAPGPRERSWEPPSYLATLDPERARARIGRFGWRALSGRYTSSSSPS